jgi:hypothetical protein
VQGWLPEGGCHETRRGQRTNGLRGASAACERASAAWSNARHIDKAKACLASRGPASSLLAQMDKMCGLTAPRCDRYAAAAGGTAAALLSLAMVAKGRR